MIERKRIMHLFHLLSNAAKPQTSFELAQVLEVSERTLKSDIKELRAFVSASGGMLVSRRNVGYWIETVDQEHFNRIKKQLDILFLSGDQYRLGSLDNRTNIILRKLLIEEDYLKLDDISEALFLTKSSLKKDLKEVRRIINSYNLKLETKPGSGNILVGKEFDKRLCMLRVFEYHYYEAEPLFNDEPFVRLFACDNEERNDIRHIFNRVMRESPVHLIDNFLNWLVRYLTLMRNRVNSGYQVTFTNKQKAGLRKYLHYQVAADIIHELQIFPGFDVSEDEIMGFEVLLLIWNDLPSDRDFKREYPLETAKVEEILPEITAEIRQNYHLDISQVPSYQRLLTASLIPVFFQMQYSCEEYSVLGGFGYNDEIRFQPLSIALSFTVFTVLRRHYDTEFSIYNHLIVASRFCSLFTAVKYAYQPRRALICSAFGIETAEMIKSVILTAFANGEFSRIDAFELYEMRKLQHDDYDFVILNIPDYVYKYDWPHTPISMRPSHEELLTIYYRFIVNGLRIEDLLSAKDLGVLTIYKKFNFESVESFVRLVSYKLASQPDDVGLIANEVNRNFIISIINNISFIFVSRKYVGHNQIDLYELDKPATYFNQKFSYVIIAVIDCGDNMIKAKFYDDLSRIIMSSPPILQQIVSGITLNDLLAMIKQKL